MTTHAEGSFELKSFDEEPYEELDGGAKLTRARIVQALTGGLDGELTADLLMYYRRDATASYAGFQRYAGRIGDRSGTVVMWASGGYDGTQATASASVVPGSGTGDLRELRGDFTSAAPSGPTGTYTFDYDNG
jgi:Protein of unknown function (DUF3224)